jgi:hypothetical protein
VRERVQLNARRLRRELAHKSEAPLQRLAIDLEARFSLVGDYIDSQNGSLLNRRGRARGCASLYLALASRLLSTYDRLGIGKQAAPVEGDDLVQALMRGGADG